MSTDPAELLSWWTDECHKHPSPAQVQSRRTELMEHCGMFIPHRRAHLEGYISRMKGQLTRRLREAVEAAEESGE